MALIAQRAALVTLLALASVSCSKPVVVMLHNNTKVDLTVRSGRDEAAVHIPPGSAAEVTLQESQWIDFGMIARRYAVPGLRYEAFLHGPARNRVKVQAERDGRLYLVLPDAAFPSIEPAPQPPGFPLSPEEQVDLT